MKESEISNTNRILKRDLFCDFNICLFWPNTDLYLKYLICKRLRNVFFVLLQFAFMSLINLIGLGSF